jgi:phosphoribosylformylglycinamidine cyclo-ligase
VSDSDERNRETGDGDAEECSLPLTYATAGVDVEAGKRAVDLIKDQARSTFSEEVLSGLGGFAGLFDAGFKGINNPVLVSSADGVGTKLKLAQMMDKHDTIGIDLVAMCVDDIICSGARPLFLLDYLCMDKVVPEKVAEIMQGVVKGCRKAGCALLGGETAEHPGLLGPGEYDLAGFAVGVVEKDAIIDGSTICPPDAIIGLASTGLHSNGYSLARKLFFEINDFNIDDHLRGLTHALGKELLAPTEIYTPGILKVMEKVNIKGMAHITGGGIIDNLPRVLPPGTDAVIDISTWPNRSIFQVIQKTAGIEQAEMFKTFNMGIGMAVVVDHNDIRETMEIFANNAYRPYYIGEVLEGSGGIKLTC